MSVNHRTQGEYPIRVTVSLDPKLHKRISDAKYAKREGGEKVTIEQLIINAIIAAYPEHQRHGLKIL